MFEVVSNSDFIAMWTKEISCSCGKQGGKCHAEISLTGELIDGSSTNGGPHESASQCTLVSLDELTNSLLLRLLLHSIRYK